MTYLPSRVLGRWFRLYLILDLHSRKIVGVEVHISDDADHASHMVRSTVLAERIAAMETKPVLRGDNGSTLTATTVQAMCTGWASSLRTRGPVSATTAPMPSRCSAPSSTTLSSRPRASTAWTTPELGRRTSCVGTTSPIDTAESAMSGARERTQTKTANHPGDQARVLPQAQPRNPARCSGNTRH